ncbi:larval cuticle protein A2B [Anabrus simplex]|uniref:larval cuticle protein A2B n=1 Tax=Anabrus simplex TaxID=316456 RepID=UPI0035A326A2
MMSKFIILAALVTIARGGFLGAVPSFRYISSAPAVAAAPEPYDANPQYSYGYNVQDAITGDTKGQHETRNGDVVQGSYSVVDPDGTRRTVEYTADPVNGFNAVVHREPVAIVHKAPVIAKVAAPIAVARYAPAPAPIFAAAPAVTKTVIAAPAPAAYYKSSASTNYIGSHASYSY